MSLRRLLLSLLALSFVFGCSVETQKARESFDDHKLPAELTKLANQTADLARVKSAIVERVTKENKSNLVRVAVIDNGTDIAHPDLINKLDYRVENGEITGVGHDFMGDDEFPSSSLVNPELFSFNAAEIRNGLIVKGEGNVFAKLLDLDAKFSTFFLAKLKNHSVLSKSLFRKLTAQSFNVFGLYPLIHTKDAIKATFDQTTYNDNKTLGKLLTENFRNEVTSNVALQDYGASLIYNLLDKATFEMTGTSGATFVFSYLSAIEHGDLMIGLLQESFEQFPQINELKKGIDNVVEFRLGRDHSLNAVKSNEVGGACSLLSKAVEYHKQGVVQVDPITRMRSSTENELLANLDLTRKATEYPLVNIKPTAVNDGLESGIAKFKIYLDATRSIDKTTTEQLGLKYFERDMNKYINAAKAFTSMRASEVIQLFDPNFKSEYTSLYRQTFHRASHPYLSTFSASESHGTHTAGIVVAQNENIRIFPIRITTRSALVTKQEKQNLLNFFKINFESWLANPIVVRALSKKLPKMLPAGFAEPITEEDRKKLASSLMKTLEPGLQVAFEESPLDFLFFKELEESMILVANQKIKVASISLGSELTNRIPQFKDLDPENDLSTVFKFLNFEFVKFHMGQILATQAKDTLFVVAAGNSKMWIDGKTHSALPVDLTSRFLKPFENGVDLIAPNNHLENVLGVGSLSPDDDLSDFTNILLGLKTNIIFAVGEDVLSPIKTTDNSPAMSVINKKLPNIGLPIFVDDPRVLPKLYERPLFSGLKDTDKGDQKISNYVLSGLQHIVITVSAFKTHLAMKYSDHREKYSGTSMATPAVAGVISDLILKKTKKINIATIDIYGHPAFSPNVLINDLRSISEPLFPESPELNFRKINVMGKYQRGDKIQKLDQYLDGL